MTATALFIAQLRALGVSVRSNGPRLIVAAPRGVITSELREQMARLKPHILYELEAEAPALYADTPAWEAIREIAALLATAYRRRQELQREQVGLPRKSVDDALANLARSSVHGVVP